MKLQGMLKRDVLCGIFFLAVAVFAVQEMCKTSIWTATGPKEGFFPLLLGIILVILSITLITTGFFSRLTGSSADKASSPDSEHTPRKRGRVVLYVSSFIGYAALLAYIGFVLDSLLLLVILLRFAENQSWRATVTISIASVLLSYLLFRVMLIIPLPSGLIL